MEPERCCAPKKEGENVTNMRPSGSNPVILCSQSNSLGSGQSNSQGVSSHEPLIYKKQPMPRKEPPPNTAAIASPARNPEQEHTLEQTL